MNARKVLAPEQQLRGQRSTEQEPRDESETARSRASVDPFCPNVHISRRSRIVSALVLGLSGFAVAFLVGHLAAAICGWHFVIYGGFALGVWFFAACLVAFLIAGAVRRD